MSNETKESPINRIQAIRLNATSEYKRSGFELFSSLGFSEEEAQGLVDEDPAMVSMLRVTPKLLIGGGPIGVLLNRLAVDDEGPEIAEALDTALDVKLQVGISETVVNRPETRGAFQEVKNLGYTIIEQFHKVTPSVVVPMVPRSKGELRTPNGEVSYLNADYPPIDSLEKTRQAYHSLIMTGDHKSLPGDIRAILSDLSQELPREPSSIIREFRQKYEGFLCLPSDTAMTVEQSLIDRLGRRRLSPQLQETWENIRQRTSFEDVVRGLALASRASTNSVQRRQNTEPVLSVWPFHEKQKDGAGYLREVRVPLVVNTISSTESQTGERLLGDRGFPSLVIQETYDVIHASVHDRAGNFFPPEKLSLDLGISNPEICREIPNWRKIFNKIPVFANE
jgi:hypothetical protein